MRLALAAFTGALPLAICGCGDDGLEYIGEPGQPVAARFASWVPGVDVSVESGATRRFLVDTGAPLTMLDTDDFSAMEQGRQKVDLEGFALVFPSFSVAAFDVFTYEQDDENRFAGIVGGDLLSAFALRLDYRGGRVWLETDLEEPDPGLPAGFDPAGVETMQTVSMQVRGGGLAVVPGECEGTCGTIRLPASRALVEVSLEEGSEPVWMLVDTGASAVVVDPATIESLPIADRPRLDGVTVGTAAGAVTAYFTRVRSLGSWGGAVAETDLPVLVLPDDTLFEGIELETGVPVRGLLGGSFLRSYLTTLDFPSERLALARYLDQGHIDHDEFVRVGFTMAKHAGVWEVQDVYPGTDAAADGVLSGDTVTTLDGEAIQGLDQDAVAAILGRFVLGEEVPVGVERGTATESFLVEVEDLLPRFEAP